MDESDDSASKDSSKTRYLRMKAFLEPFQLTPLEAQIILEVCNSKEYYIDTSKLRRKLPKVFNKFSFNLEKILKNLIQKCYLSPYESKKDELCVRSASFGRDFAKMAEREGFDSFEELPLLEEKYSRVKLMCYDPQGFKCGEVRYARGSSGDKIKVQIIDIGPSDEIWGVSDDGRTIYAIRLIGNAECPRCSNQIPMDFSYTPDTCYSSFNEFRCAKCNYRFMLGCSLTSYYT